MSDIKKPPTSRDVSLKAKPTITEPLSEYNPAEGDLETREQELELEEETFRGRTKKKGGLTGGQLAFIVIVLIIVVVAVLVGIYLLTRNTFNPGPRNFASVGEDCTTLPCASPLVCEGGICRGVLGSPCLGSNCSTGFVCFNGQCLAGLYNRCDSAEQCAPGLICSQDTCLTAP